MVGLIDYKGGILYVKNIFEFFYGTLKKYNRKFNVSIYNFKFQLKDLD